LDTTRRRCSSIRPSRKARDNSIYSRIETFRGEHRAERKSRQTGSSLEFADYRNYSLGDDLRTIDWNIYGRLDRLFVKLFEQEQDLHIYFLIDASASMRWQPSSSSRRPPLPRNSTRPAASPRRSPTSASPISIA
jgi:hypothetical protein